MSSRRKICVVTGSRADYGLLYWLMRDLQADRDIELQLVVTGMHLAPEFGLTYRQIENDGFVAFERVEMLVSSDTAAGTAKSIGLGLIGFADVFSRLQPDILVVLGDRFEIFAAAQAALVATIPIAHIAGGDTTEGAYDEAVRHSITKMAGLHFVTNAVAARRLEQMGEEPANIHNVGSPGIDGVHRVPRLDRNRLKRELKCEFRPRNLLVTFHPVTLEPGASEHQFAALLTALGKLEDIGLFFTWPNADTGGRRLIEMLEAFVADRHNAYAFQSLGQLHYLSLMAQVDAVVGNSSSGLYEAPSLKKAAVNIGDRQRGRLMATSVINCEPDEDAILVAVNAALVMDCANAVNPYGDGRSSERIAAVLKGVPNPKVLVKKRFRMLEAGHD